MDTSDDPATMLLIGGAAAGGVAASGGFGGSGIFGGSAVDRLSARPETVTSKRTAAPQEQLSETARRNRRRRSASILSQNFAPPTLGMGGQLGI